MKRDLTCVSLFSGIGGFDLAAEWAGFRIVLQCEIDSYCRAILETHWPNVPIIEDVKNVNRETINRIIGNIEITLVVAGVPCQPISTFGKRKGQNDYRWLWPETFNAVSELQPDWVCFENPTGLNSLELQCKETNMEGQTVGVAASLWVREKLERLGYAVCAVVIPACAVNAIHRRDRIFIIAHANGKRQTCGKNIYDLHYDSQPAKIELCGPTKSNSGKPKSCLCLLDDGIPQRVAGLPAWYGGDWQSPPPLIKNIINRTNQLQALGNAVVPEQAYPILKAIAEWEMQNDA